MNTFIFSSSRITRSLVYNIEYVLNINISNIVVLTENHSLEDFYFTSSKIILCQNISEALLLSDIVIIINNGKLPEQKMNYIKKRGLENNQRIISIDINSEKRENSTLVYNQHMMNKMPTIMNIGIGDASLTYCMEIYLNKFFKDKGVNLYQTFTQYTKNIISSFEGASLINSNLIFSSEIDSVIKSNYELYIKSDFFDDINSMIQSLDIVDLYKPNYVIFNGNARFNEQYDLETIFKYRFGCNIYIVKSKYIDVHKDEHNNKLILCPSLCGNDFICDKEFDTDFEHNLNVNLAFPESIHIM